MSASYNQFAASAPVGIIELRCLELNHSSFETPVRMVHDFKDWTVTLETGESATFQAAQFRTTPPTLSDNGQIERGLQIDVIDGSLVNDILLLATSQEPLVCIYRAFLSDDLSAPQFDPPERTVLRSVSINRGTLTASAQSADVINRKFPRRLYTTDNTPGLNR